MAYKIESVFNHKIESKNKYFLDANIWINILAAPQKPKYRIKSYLDFFDKLLISNDIKIVVPMLLISEVVNRIIRDVYFASYLNKNGLNPSNIDRTYFKEKFRPSQEYIDSYNILIDDFNSYNPIIEFVNDGLGVELSSNDILENVDQHFDFNDNFYYQLALKRNYIVVTDDGDFWRENVTIVSNNKALLDKQTAISIRENSSKEVIKFGSFNIRNRIDDPKK